MCCDASGASISVSRHLAAVGSSADPRIPRGLGLPTYGYGDLRYNRFFTPAVQVWLRGNYHPAFTMVMDHLIVKVPSGYVKIAIENGPL